MKKGMKGFTLIELLVVVSIISIIAAIAYPSYRRSVEAGGRVSAQGDLEAAAGAMAAFRAQNFTYKGAELGTGGVFRDRSPDSGVTRYNLAFDNGGDKNEGTNTFILYARPTGPAAGTGVLGINEQGQRCWDETNDVSCTPGEAGKEWK